MIRRWLATHKSLAFTTTSATLVAALVTTVALMSGGYTAQRADLNDASVWVANGDEQFIGRANTEVLELNTVVASESAEIEIVQSGSTVLLFNRADATIDVVDAATSEITDSVPLPPNQPQVHLAGENVIIYAQGTGELWVLPSSEIANYDATQEAQFNLGADTVISVDERGLLVGFSPSTGQVFQFDAAVVGDIDDTEASSLTTAAGQASVTSVGGRWIVLDRVTNRIDVGGRIIELSEYMDVATSPVLQEASSSGTSALVGFSGGLLRVPLDGSLPKVASNDGGGAAAAPVVVDDCEFAAWTNGRAWRHCRGASADGTLLELEALDGSADLRFSVNERRAVLNDAISGNSWAVQSAGELINNWDDLIEVEQDQEEIEENDTDTPPETEKDQKPPVAVDDDFGARPSRTSVLPVLLNDYDPNGDVLVVTTVTTIDPAVGRIDVINSGQQLQISLEASARGSVPFSYTISDGRGGTATAKVTVSIREVTENAPPRQVRSTKALVAAGAKVTSNVLGDWVDPDGDPFYLASATATAPDSVTFKPEGEVIFNDSGEGSSSKQVALVVSDGTDEGGGSLGISVRKPGQVPIIADPFVVLAYAGQEVTISPLAHVRGGTGELRLNAVQPQSGVTITPSYEDGTFRFSSEQVRTYYLEYVVTDDDATATGLVRVDVAAPPESNTTPITIPKTVFVTTLSSKVVDVAGTDIDPAGGVLLVTGVTDVPRASNVRADVLEQRLVRITLTGPVDQAVVVRYRISNGLAEAEGTITVIELPPPTRAQPPIARDDKATVRVGDAITIPVLANDEQPDGETITLNQELVRGLEGTSGLAFASNNTVRYLAPNRTGDFVVQYEVISENGQTAQAEVRIQVREPNLETNHAPVAATVTSRVLAGKTIRVDIPLDGIDADGDSVQLLGQDSSPEKGTVTEVGTNFLMYEAGQYSAGTDTFTYSVMDALGARSTGTVRVGISASLASARNPVAIEDIVQVRPGASVSIQVLANDSDPDGSPLRVSSIDPSGITAEVVDDEIVSVMAPETPGRYSLVYSIENEIGGSSSNFIVLEVDEDAPLSFPIAQDTVLSLSDVIGQTSIDVDVLANVFFADGRSRELGVTVLTGYGSTAEVLPNKSLRVTIGDQRQIIPFSVAHPDDSSIRAYAFVWVPGFNDALPQLDKRAPALVVNSEETLTIDLNDYVIAVGDNGVRLTDSSTVQATYSNGEPLVVDQDTLKYTSADLYFGNASISFEVTDGTSANDPNGRTANLVLPIEVRPRANQAPVITGAVIDFEQGQQKSIDLTAITNYPYLDDIDELEFSVLSPAPVGFTYDISGQNLTLRANDDAVKGTTTAISLAVRDATQEGQSGRIELRIVPSTRPLAIPAPDSAVTQRGETTVIDVLSNDEATNPFPGEPLRVVAVRGLEGSTLPAGVKVTASADNRKLTITIADSAEPLDTSLQYQVSDATRDPDRYVWGSVKISVQDVPDAPAKPVRQADAFVGGELKLRITPTLPNNSPITKYSVISSSNGANFSQDCGLNQVCSLTGLVVGAEYRFQVVATNGIGDSEPSPLSDPYTVDYRPRAPEGVTAEPTEPSSAPNGRSITVKWDTVPDPNPGTPVSGYVVEIKGPGVNYSANATSPFTTTAGGELVNNATYTVSVYARNNAQVLSAADWRRTSRTVTTVGPPISASPGPRTSINPDNSNGEIRVTWGASDPNGAGSVTYSIGRVNGSASAPSCSTGGGKPYEADGSGGASVSSGWIDTNTVDGETYTYFVYADNGYYCTASATGAVESKRPPGEASGSATVAYSGDGQYDIFAGGDLSASGIVAKFQYQLNGSGAWRDVENGQQLTSRANTSHYANPTTVTYRACRDSSEDYCGAASGGSTVTPVNTRARVSSCVIGIPPESQEPANAGPVSVTYDYSYRLASAPDDWTNYDYSGSDNVPSDALEALVRATVTVGGDTFVDQDPESGEQRPCSS